MIEKLMNELSGYGLDMEIKIYFGSRGIIYNVRYKTENILYEPWSSEKASSYGAMIDNLQMLAELYG